MMKRRKSDVVDMVEGRHLRVEGEDPQVIQQLSGAGLPLKGERRMVPLRITNRKVLVESDHVHARGGSGGH